MKSVFISDVIIHENDISVSLLLQQQLAPYNCSSHARFQLRRNRSLLHLEHQDNFDGSHEAVSEVFKDNKELAASVSAHPLNCFQSKSKYATR